MKKLLITVAACLLICLGHSVQAQTITTFAGNGSYGRSGDGGPATAANIASYGICKDTAGNFYISDFTVYGIKKISPSGVITTIAGTGSYGYSGDGGPATAAGFESPRQIAYGNGNLYIADEDSKRVRKINLSTGIVTTFAGNGSTTSSGDGGQATAAGLSPVAIATYGTDVYVVDDQRIRKIDVSGIITAVAGSSTCGYSGDGGPATAAVLCYPRSLAFDVSGNLYIAAASNYCIRKISTSGIITRIAGTGSYSYSGDGGQATAAGVRFPQGIFVDSTGNIFFTEGMYGYRVRKISTSGIITTIAGNGSSTYSGDGGQATAAGFTSAEQLYVESNGTIYVADYLRLRKIKGCKISTSFMLSNDSVHLTATSSSATHIDTFSMSGPARGARRDTFIITYHVADSTHVHTYCHGVYDTCVGDTSGVHVDSITFVPISTRSWYDTVVHMGDTVWCSGDTSRFSTRTFNGLDSVTTGTGTYALHSTVSSTGGIYSAIHITDSGIFVNYRRDSSFTYMNSILVRNHCNGDTQYYNLVTSFGTTTGLSYIDSGVHHFRRDTIWCVPDTTFRYVVHAPVFDTSSRTHTSYSYHYGIDSSSNTSIIYFNDTGTATTYTVDTLIGTDTFMVIQNGCTGDTILSDTLIGHYDWHSTSWTVVDSGIHHVWLDTVSKDSTAGINQIAHSAVNLYPNPATNIVNISCSFAEYSVIVYDGLGKKMLEIQNAKSFETKDFVPGVYIVYIKIENKIWSQKLIVQ